MTNRLKLLFATILAVMLYTTAMALRERGLFEAGAVLWRDAWFRATLADAYCGFLTFYAWLFYKERSWPARAGWLVAILALGNIAMSAYVLRALVRLPAGAGVERLLLRDGAARP
jgi:uncharacterized membrane protein YeiB